MFKIKKGILVTQTSKVGGPGYQKLKKTPQVSGNFTDRISVPDTRNISKADNLTHELSDRLAGPHWVIKRYFLII